MKLIIYLVVGHIAASWLCRRDWVAPFPAETAVGFSASARSLFYTTVLITVLALAMPTTANTITLGLGAVGIFATHRWGSQMLLLAINQGDYAVAACSTGATSSIAKGRSALK